MRVSGLDLLESTAHESQAGRPGAGQAQEMKEFFLETRMLKNGLQVLYAEWYVFSPGCCARRS